jgi:peptidoglycan-associated lipoprotein
MFPMRSSSSLALCAVLAAGIVGQGCAKKVAVTAPAAPKTTSPPAPVRAAESQPVTPAPVRQAESTPTPTSRMPDEATKRHIDEILRRIEDAYFDYNKHTLRPDAIQALQSDSTELRDILKNYPDYRLTIEGHCDERGSDEYNLALGNERAASAKAYLVQVGIPDMQLGVMSYGKEKPVCNEQTESCWQKNRRIHIVAVAR